MTYYDETKRKRRFVVTGLLLLVALGMVLVFVVRPAYSHHKERRAIRQAREFLKNKDYPNASLCARQALQANPSNVEACEVMAQLAEISRSPLLVDWRQRVANLSPTITNRLLLASAALRQEARPFTLAAQTLDQLGATATNLATFHTLSAELALKLQNPAGAEASFARATFLEPTNALHRLNLAVLQLRSTNRAVVVEARTSLERLEQSREFGAVALRWLLGEALRARDLGHAQTIAGKLLAHPQATLEDRLLHCDIVRQARTNEFAPLLEKIQSEASGNAVQAHSVAMWMNTRGMTEEAFQWLSQLPDALKNEQPLPLAFVESYKLRQDWQMLERYLLGQTWGDLEFLRYGHLAHAAHSREESLAARHRWAMALQKAGSRIGALTTLAGMAYPSQSATAREDLLWKVATYHPRETWALRELEKNFVKARNTPSLFKVYAAMCRSEPGNYYARNNYAATALLLKRDLTQAHTTARELYTAHPDEPIVTSTYAYSLHLQGRTRAGLDVLERLPPEKLRSPGVALYYGLLLSADGQADKAREYLSMKEGADLLPEEQGLFAEAQKSVENSRS